MANNERLGEGQESINPLQAHFDEWMSTQKPRVDEFEKQLFTNTPLLRSGQMTPADFFDGLMGDGKPLSTFVRAEAEPGYVEQLTVARTAERKLLITSQEVGSIPSVTAQVGLSLEGQLIVEKVGATRWDDEEGLQAIEGNTVITDTLDVIVLTEHGQLLLDLLLKATPYPNKPEELEEE